MLISELEKKINYKFINENILKEALIHSSYVSKKNNPGNQSYERLEFLGDRVLGLILAEYFYKTFPDANEGSLNNYFQKNANQDFLAQYAKQINLSKFIMTQKGDNLSNNNSVLSDVVEAIIAAIYLDSGIEKSKKFIVNEIINKIPTSFDNEKHSKSTLQEFCLKEFRCLPEYKMLDKSGLEHKPIFKVSVSIKDFKSVTAIGPNLKNAEETAASKLLFILKNKINLKASGYNNFESKT